LDSYPIAILIAVPIIAGFTIFVLLPRLRKHEEAQKRSRDRRRR
jgi:hypothetical protein